MNQAAEKELPVSIAASRWGAGVKSPIEIRVEMNNGKIRRYKLTAAQQESETKTTACRLIESWTLMELIEKNTYGGYKPKHEKNSR